MRDLEGTSNFVTSDKVCQRLIVVDIIGPDENYESAFLLSWAGELSTE